jgi:DNA-binding response OmpR family regulator
MSFEPPMEGPPRTVLLIEDNPGDARLVRERLKRGWTRNLELTHVARLDEGAAHLEAVGADCVLLDLSLPDSEGSEGVRRLVEHHPDVPVVILSGTDEEALILECLHEGAQDYLVKGAADAALIGRSIRYAVERKRAERELHGAGHGRRHVYRLSTVGVGLVLVLLAAFSIGTATVTKRATDGLERATALSAAYGQAAQAASEQSRLVARAALEAGRVDALRSEHRRAARALTDGLDGVRVSGDEEDRAAADRSASAHARYLGEAEAVFAAAAGGASPAARAGGLEAANGAFAATEQRLAAAGARERSGALRRAERLARDDDYIFVATLVVFSVGLLLLGLFGGAMRAYRGRFEQARRAELARRARSASAPKSVQAGLDTP